MNQDKSELKPPDNLSKRDFSKKYVFLGGSIEQGKANNWQADMSQFFLNFGHGTFNPRRDDWDPNLEQKSENPVFSQQVLWELMALKISNEVVMYFEPGTVSPISIMEFGKYVDSGKMYVICPEGFWRQANIEKTAEFYNCPLFDNFDQFKNFYKKINSIL
jgi:hypothetical protein